MSTMVDKHSFSIRLADEIWATARKRAVDLKMTASAFVETAILHELRRGDPRLVRKYGKEDGETIRFWHAIVPPSMHIFDDMKKTVEGIVLINHREVVAEIDGPEAQWLWDEFVRRTTERV